MTLSDTDIAKIHDILIDAGETVRKETIKLEGNKLTFVIQGTDRDSHDAINALVAGGLNWYSDGNPDTLEIYGRHSDKTNETLVTMTVRDGGLWV